MRSVGKERLLRRTKDLLLKPMGHRIQLSVLLSRSWVDNIPGKCKYKIRPPAKLVQNIRVELFYGLVAAPFFVNRGFSYELLIHFFEPPLEEGVSQAQHIESDQLTYTAP
jgi:hypothetical protein